MKAIVLIIIAALVMPGCTSLRPVPREADLSQSINVGDKVELIDSEGRVSAFTVEQIDPTMISGTSEAGVAKSVAINDIEAIKIETVDGGKTVLAVVGGIAALPIIIAGGFAFAVASCEFSC